MTRYSIGLDIIKSTQQKSNIGVSQTAMKPDGKSQPIPHDDWETLAGDIDTKLSQLGTSSTTDLLEFTVQAVQRMVENQSVRDGDIGQKPHDHHEHSSKQKSPQRTNVSSSVGWMLLLINIVVMMLPAGWRLVSPHATSPQASIAECLVLNDMTVHHPSQVDMDGNDPVPSALHWLRSAHGDLISCTARLGTRVHQYEGIVTMSERLAAHLAALEKIVASSRESDVIIEVQVEEVKAAVARMVVERDRKWYQRMLSASTSRHVKADYLVTAWELGHARSRSELLVMVQLLHQGLSATLQMVPSQMAGVRFRIAVAMQEIARARDAAHDTLHLGRLRGALLLVARGQSEEALRELYQCLDMWLESWRA